MLRQIPLTIKMLIATVIVGIVTWAFLDPLQTHTIRESFQAQLEERLHEDADENRLLFERYLQLFQQNLKIIISQKEFYNYIERTGKPDWASNPWRPDRIKYSYGTPPKWLPGPLVLRSFSHFHYAILLDHDWKTREIYKTLLAEPPDSLLEPSLYFRQLHRHHNILTDINGVLYLLTAETVHNAEGNDEATLMFATPLDNEFLYESQEKSHLVAIAGGEDPYILASNDTEHLPSGMPLRLLKGKYLFISERLIDYEPSSLSVKLVSFIPQNQYESLSLSILTKERRNRILTALLLIISFSLIMVWITKRVQNLTKNVVDFSEKKLDLRHIGQYPGDELKVLDDRFHKLTEEIEISHASLREQADILRKERDRAQNYLDIAGSIILALDIEGKITLMNKKGCAVLGYSELEVIGKDFADTFIAAGDRKMTDGLLSDLMEDVGSRHVSYETHALTSSGEERIILWYSTALRNESGEVTGILSSGEDITERKQLEKSIIEAEERERQRIGHDLHDGLGQLLTGIAFKTRGLERKLESEGIEGAETAADITHLVDEAKKQVKSLSKGLSPVEMDNEGLMTALEDLASYTQDTFGIPCEFRCSSPVSLQNKTAVTQMYRIAQEALTNAVTHGAPDRIEIALSAQDNKITMTIKDNGIGIPGDLSHSHGMGLKIMRYRASIINASLDIRPGSERGTVVICTFSDSDRSHSEPS